jgi:hypothetical protein
VALQAYRDAVRTPLLSLSVVASGDGPFVTVNASLVNDGTASARNAIVWLDLQDTASLVAWGGGDWTQEPTGGLRWEAPAGVVIHPKVPPLTLSPFTAGKSGEHLLITYTVAADGFGPATGTFPDRKV